MKSKVIVFLLSTILVSEFCNAQDIMVTQVPPNILQAFNKKYKDVINVEWELDGDRYSVEFHTNQGVEHEIWYEKSGSMYRHVYDISKNDLPKAVRAIIKKEFGMCTLDDIERIEMTYGVSYQMEIHEIIDEWKVIISESGKIISKWSD